VRENGRCALTLLVGRLKGHPACKKLEWWGAGVVICLELGAGLHMAQMMPLPLTVSCFGKIQIGFIFLVPAHPGSPGKRAVKRMRVIGKFCGKFPANFEHATRYVRGASEDMPAGQTPHTIIMFAHNDLVDAVQPGDRVTVTGIYRAMPLRANPRQRNVLSVYKTHVDVVHYRKMDTKRLHEADSSDGSVSGSLFQILFESALSRDVKREPENR